MNIYWNFLCKYVHIDLTVMRRLLVTAVIGHVHMCRCNSDEVFEYVGVNDSPIAYSYIRQKKLFRNSLYF